MTGFKLAETRVRPQQQQTSPDAMDLWQWVHRSSSWVPGARKLRRCLALWWSLVTQTVVNVLPSSSKSSCTNSCFLDELITCIIKRLSSLILTDTFLANSIAPLVDHWIEPERSFLLHGIYLWRDDRRNFPVIQCEELLFVQVFLFHTEFRLLYRSSFFWPLLPDNPQALYHNLCGIGLAKQPDIPLQWAAAQGFTLLSFPTKSMTLRVLRTIQQGHDNEMKMSAESCATQIPFTLSQCGVPHWESADQCVKLCIVMCAREKCASARVQAGVVSTPPCHTHGCCYWLSAKFRFSNFCGRKIEQDCNQIKWLRVTTLSLSSWVGSHQFPGCYLDFIENASSMLSLSPFFWPFVVLPPVRVPFLPTPSPWRRTPPCWAW